MTSRILLITMVFFHLAGTGCTGTGTFRLHLVLPDEEAEALVESVEVWVMGAGMAACAELTDCSVRPEDLSTLGRAVVHPEPGSGLLRNVPAGEVLFFAEGRTGDGARVLRGCKPATIKATGVNEIAIELAWVCHPWPDGEIADNGLDDDCDCLTDECVLDADCNDENGCTFDFCLDDACHHSASDDGTACNDGDSCTSGDHCEAGACTGDPRDCSELDDVCLLGMCQEGVCIAVPEEDGAPCDDGLYCTVDDGCASGTCEGAPRDCDDGDGCTRDSCIEGEQRCAHTLEPRPGEEGPQGDASCGNGTDDDCDGLTDGDDPSCLACATDEDCDDDNSCTRDTCDAADCVYTEVADGTGCDDGQYCTVDDACTAGSCFGVPRDCSAGAGPCQTGVCLEEDDRCGLQPRADGTSCSDGLYCTVGDACQGGACTGGSERTCDDGDGCTRNSCDEESDSCLHAWYIDAGAEGPEGEPNCGNGVDDDCDGRTDAGDPSCGAPLDIHRSVGPGNTDPLAAGTGDPLVLEGPVARFASPLPDRAGAGDVLVYDTNDDQQPDTLAFIYRRISSSQFLITDADGLHPEGIFETATWSLYRAYTALNAAVSMSENNGIPQTLRNFDQAGTDMDLIATDTRWHIACYADAPDTTLVMMGDWINDADHFIRIYTPASPAEVGSSQRHTGKWTENAYMLVAEDTDWSGVLFIGDSIHTIRIEGLQIENTAAKNNGEVKGIRTMAHGNARITQNLVRCTGGGTGGPEDKGFWLASGVPDSVLTMYVWNNIVIDFGIGIYKAGQEDVNLSGAIYNNTIVGSDDTGIQYWTPPMSGSQLYLKNNLVQGSGTAYAGDNLAGHAGNLSQDASSPDTTLRNRTVQFADPAVHDFHLAVGDTAARDAGQPLEDDPIFPFSSDIDGQTRSGPWDIGADEVP